jgi:hypothetical protein
LVANKTVIIFRELNGELTSRSKCKPLALPTHLQECIQKATNVIYPADTVSTEYQNQRLKESQKILLDRKDSIELIGNTEILFLDNCKETQQTIVFLPESLTTVSFPNTQQLTLQATNDQAIEGSISTANSQQQPVDFSFPEELFWTTSERLPAIEIPQGELHTPEIGKLENPPFLCMNLFSFFFVLIRNLFRWILIHKSDKNLYLRDASVKESPKSM